MQGLPQNQERTQAPPHKTPPNSQLSQDYKTLSILAYQGRARALVRLEEEGRDEGIYS